MEGGRYIKVLTLVFDKEIEAWEIPLFRGAVIASIGDDVNKLYHNHEGENGFRYSYPLIQYKTIRRKAAIVCIDEGVDIIGQLLSEESKDFVLGERNLHMDGQNIIPSRVLVQIWNEMFKYKMRHWLALNEENYVRYKSTESLTERIDLLQNILKGNLLSFCKGLGIRLTEELKVEITNLSVPKPAKCKGIKRLSFDVDFKCNLSIPNHIGIGKSSSIGFGTIYRYKNKTEKDKSSNNDTES